MLYAKVTLVLFHNSTTKEKTTNSIWISIALGPRRYTVVEASDSVKLLTSWRKAKDEGEGRQGVSHSFYSTPAMASKTLSVRHHFLRSFQDFPTVPLESRPLTQKPVEGTLRSQLQQVLSYFSSSLQLSPSCSVLYPTDFTNACKWTVGNHPTDPHTNQNDNYGLQNHRQMGEKKKEHLINVS